MKPDEPRVSAMMRGPLTCLVMAWCGLAWAASPPPSNTQPAQSPGTSPKSQLVQKFLHDCAGKPAPDANCQKLRKDSAAILVEDLRRLGSTANRKYLPAILRMFSSEEPELRIAAADAIGMIGPQDQDVAMLIPWMNDSVPDVRHAVSNMLAHGKGNAVSLLKTRIQPIRQGSAPEKPVDAGKLGLPVAPNSFYFFDSSDVSVGRLSYVAKNMNEVTSFYKGKAKKGPFPLQEFKDKYRYQIQDEDEAMRLVHEAKVKELEGVKPPDPTNVQAFTEYMQKVTSAGLSQGARTSLNLYEPNLFGSPTVYVLEERQVGKRSYPTRYVVLYQDLAFKQPGYRLAWTTVPDEALKAAQVASLKEQKEEDALKAATQRQEEAAKKRESELESLMKKKDAAEKKEFKKGQSELGKELGF
jgi:hypothetical protein